jgi:hypothetical protein
MPAYGNFQLDKGYDADAAITKFRAVKEGTNPESVTPVVASTDNTLGIAQFDVATTEIARGKGCSVRESGISEWEAGAAITRGQEVMADANGRCIVATGAGNRVVGRARQTCTALG